MDSRREALVSRILAEALDRPPEEQRRLVVDACSDPHLAAEILALLAADDDFLEQPAIAMVADSEAVTLGDLPPSGPMRSAETRPLAPKVGPYRIEERLGGGGMGLVYRGYDDRLQRPVALKQIRGEAEGPEARRRFQREARAIARLDHPGIVRVHDWLRQDDSDWLVMELIEGRHLGQILEAEGPQPADRVVAWAADIAGALAAAHDAGILHRDLKPDNVMVTAGGGLKLLDFGLAKPLGQAGDFGATLDEPLTLEGNILGTVTAMSPEQAAGEELDERSDLFSLGTLMYRLLAGKPPFLGEYPMETLRAIVYDSPDPLEALRPDLPASLLRLIDQLLAKNRDHRPRHARLVLAQLGEIARGMMDRDRPDIDTSQSSLRRPVTVLAVDLSPGLDAADPEALLDIVPRIDMLLQEVAMRWGGRLEGRMGDTWVACFGVPTAREDDARRAVHAGLDLVQGVANLQHAGDRTKPAVRVGIHSGTAIITTVGERQELALGPTFDAAIDAQQGAESGVLMSAATRARVGRFFRSTPVDAADTFKVEGVDDFTEMQAGRSRVLVGRGRELQSLLESFTTAREGFGRVVLLCGESGIGKTSLLAQLQRELSKGHDEAPSWIEMHGSTVRRSSPFLPIVVQLRKIMDLQEGDPEAQQLEALTCWAEGLQLPAAEVVPHLAVLLGLSEPDRDPRTDLDPRLRKRRIQEALATVWTEMADHQPLVLDVEDQGLDPSTVEVLTLLIEQAPTVPMLLILTHRLEYRPPWNPRGHIAEMRLERLGGQAVAEQVAAISGAALPRQLVERIAAKADGVPLYIEELTRVVLESGQLSERDGRFELDGPLDRLIIPSTLEESLAARLDRLGKARNIAQLASVIGREFTLELLLEISEAGEAPSLEDDLERLVEADLVYRKGFGRRARYLFRHSLIQDAAYTSLLRRQRSLLHRRVAGALGRTGRQPAPPEVLAHHLNEAGEWRQAVAYWQAAGTAALLASAHREAEAHARRALQVLEARAEGDDRDHAELGVLTLLGRSVAGLKGYSSEQVLEAYDRAAELCGRIDDDPLVTQVNWGLWAFYNVRSDIRRALTHAGRLLQLAERAGSTSDWLVAHSSMSVAHYFGGDLAAARRHAEAAIEYDAANPERQRTLASPQDLGVNALMSLALVAWHLGDSGGAVSWSRRGIELARQFDHPYSQVFAGAWSARLHQSRREAGETRRLAEQVVRISEQHGFFWATQGWFFRGCAMAQEARDRRPEGDRIAEVPSEAIDWMQRGIAAYRATGARLSLSYMAAQMAEVHLWRGDLEAARASLQEAREAAAPGREGYWRPELHRLSGEIRLTAGGVDHEAAAQADFRRALELAEHAGDHALGLRAALSLARSWLSSGRKAEAGNLLTSKVELMAGAHGDPAGDGDLDAARRLLTVIYID